METKDLSSLSPQDREFCLRQERSTITGENGVCRHISVRRNADEKADEKDDA